MENTKLSEIDVESLLNMGINPIKFNDYQVLCLPENFQKCSKNNLFDADLSCKLSKRLKQSGIRCANSMIWVLILRLLLGKIMTYIWA